MKTKPAGLVFRGGRPGARVNYNADEVLRPNGRRHFDLGERVEIRDGGAWLGAEYVGPVGRRMHAVRIDGDGSPMARRREVDSYNIRRAGER